MTDVDRTTNIFDFTDAVHNILKQREKLFGTSKVLLFVLFSCSSIMIFQGESYRNFCLSIIVGLCMIASDSRVHERLLGMSSEYGGVRGAIGSFLGKIFLNKLLFCILCFLVALTINMSMIPITWMLAASVGISLLKKIFTEDLEITNMSNILFHLGFLALLVFSLNNLKKSKIVIYSVFFSFFGSTILWITLEAILNENLGFSRACNVFFRGEFMDFIGISQLYPFLLLMAIGVFTQVRINTLVFAYGKKRFASIIVKRSENKVIEV
ncbi:hypothetical protein P7C65_07s2g11610 [Encephalitozoon intestinalis]|nr:hypothetical protein GPK93_07g12330 [Encephalitozoon intestinalis]